MSPKAIINFLRKTAAVLLWLALFSTLANLTIGIRGIIIDQSPVKGYHAAAGISVGFYVRGLSIAREANHESRFYSKDKRIKISEKNDYMVQVEARSLFYWLALFVKTLELSMITAIFWSFMRLLRQVNLQDPFDQKLVTRLKSLALLFIILDVIKLLQNVNFSVFLSRAFLWTSVQMDMIYSVGGNIITGLIILVIALVFQRGIELQDENALTV